MEFPEAFTDVLVDWVRNSSFMLIKPSWREVPFLIVLPKVGPSFFLKHLTLMTLEGLFDLLTLFARQLCAIVIANFLLLLFCRGLHWYTMRCISSGRK